MKSKCLFAVTLIIAMFMQSGFANAAERIKIVATTSTIASLAREVAGDLAEVYSVAPPKRDIHFVAPNPRDVLKVKKADVFIHGGLDLEAWREPLLDAAGNRAFLGAAGASIDVSSSIRLLEVPDSVSRIGGDIHIFGNPHYWLDPENGKAMAGNIADGLARLYPQYETVFRKNFETFRAKLDGKLRGWERRAARFSNMAVIEYHKSWVYFAERFGLQIVGQIEPKPGIPPTAKHIAQLLRTVREKNVKAIIAESFREMGAPRRIAREAGIPVIELAQSAGESDDANDYINMMEYNIRLIEGVLSSEGE